MICPNCGADVRDGIPFCSECGRPMNKTTKRRKRPKQLKETKAPKKVKELELEPEEAPEEEAAPEVKTDAAAAPDTSEKKKKPKKKKKKWKLVLALILIAALLAGAVYLYVTLPAFRVQRAMQQNSEAGYLSAAEIYTAEVKDNFLHNWLTTQLCKDDVPKAADAYFAGELSYESACTFYEAFSARGDSALGMLAAEKLDEIERDHAVKEILAEGDAAFAAGDYVAAMEAYEKVPEESDAYKTAQQKLSECRERYVESISDRVDKLLGQGSYAEAIGVLDEGLAVVPGDELLLQKRGTVTVTYEALVFDQVNAALSDNDPETAISLLEDALKVLPDSTRFSDKLEEIREAQRTEAEVDSKPGKSDTDDAEAED